jgi:hypothetical protein
MIDTRTGKDLKNYPVLEDGRVYIYVMVNSAGRIKIGKTTNIQQRYQSLCGSNSAGMEIINVCCSPSTYLYTLEPIMHDKFAKYRIPNTEWFYDEENTGELTFEKVVKELHSLFSSSDYKRCNEVRKQVVENKRIKEEKDSNNDN